MVLRQSKSAIVIIILGQEYNLARGEIAKRYLGGRSGGRGFRWYFFISSQTTCRMVGITRAKESPRKQFGNPTNKNRAASGRHFAAGKIPCGFRRTV